MSEADNSNTSQQGNAASGTLLPEASVAVFSTDAETQSVVHVLQQDWRYARVKMDKQDGDIDRAIQMYQEVESPDLIIIQTDHMDEGFTAKLENLAGHLEEGTAAVVIGPVNDVYLYRRMIDMGISDYLVRPIKPEVLSDVIARTLIDRMGVSGSHLIGFVGSKGGVGTSVLTQAAAYGAADMLGQKTMLLDISGGWSTLSVGVGFEPAATLLEAVRVAYGQDEESLKRMLYHATDRLDVLATGADMMLESQVTAAQIEELIDMLMAKYPVVMVDMSHGPDILKRAVIDRAHQINVVSSLNLVALRQARSLLQEIKDVHGADESNIELILNMQGAAPSHEVSKSDIEKAMDLSISSCVPFVPKVFQSCENESRKVTGDKDGRDIVSAHILPVLQKTLGIDAPKDSTAQAASGGFLDGLLKKISSK